MQNTSIKITAKKLNLQNCYNFVQDASCGGIALFVGTIVALAFSAKFMDYLTNKSIKGDKNEL